MAAATKTIAVLVLAGEADRIVPPAQSRALFDAARSPKEWRLVKGASHNDPRFVGGPSMLDAMDRFIDEALGPGGTDPAVDDRSENGE